jgi:hypothetical protein
MLREFAVDPRCASDGMLTVVHGTWNMWTRELHLPYIQPVPSAESLRTFRTSISLAGIYTRGAQIFHKSRSQRKNFSHKVSDMNQVPYWGLRNARRRDVAHALVPPTPHVLRTLQVSYSALLHCGLPDIKQKCKFYCEVKVVKLPTR